MRFSLFRSLSFSVPYVPAHSWDAHFTLSSRSSRWNCGHLLRRLFGYGLQFQFIPVICSIRTTKIFWLDSKLCFVVKIKYMVTINKHRIRNATDMIIWSTVLHIQTQAHTLALSFVSWQSNRMKRFMVVCWAFLFRNNLFKLFHTFP